VDVVLTGRGGLQKTMRHYKHWAVEEDHLRRHSWLAAHESRQGWYKWHYCTYLRTSGHRLFTPFVVLFQILFL